MNQTNDYVSLVQLDPRIPKWNQKNLVDRLCPFCNSTGAVRYQRPDQLLVRFCDNCQAYFVSPAPSLNELNDFYQKYYESHSLSGPTEKTDVKTLLAADPRDNFCIIELQSLMDLKGKKILDVGCGKGKMMVPLRKLGAEVHGIDLDPSAIRLVEEALGFENARIGTIDELDESEKFDVIIMNDLIEHPLEPMAVMEKASRLLTENGLIMIWTPNGTFAGQEKEPICLRVDLEHMQYLTFHTCLYLAQHLNLSIVHLVAAGVLPDLRSVASGLKTLPPSTFSLKSLQNNLKSLVIRAPFFKSLNRFRHFLQSAKNNPRLGNYHLFCIFQNSTSG